MISGSMDTVCILDMYSMKIDYFNISNNTYSILPRYPNTENQLKNSRSSVISTAFLNATNTGYFVTI
jgi:hypothetical protein